jgi:hypothetical protein
MARAIIFTLLKFHGWRIRPESLDSASTPARQAGHRTMPESRLAQVAPVGAGISAARHVAHTPLYQMEGYDMGTGKMRWSAVPGAGWRNRSLNPFDQPGARPIRQRCLIALRIDRWPEAWCRQAPVPGSLPVDCVSQVWGRLDAARWPGGPAARRSGVPAFRRSGDRPSP